MFMSGMEGLNKTTVVEGDWGESVDDLVNRAYSQFLNEQRPVIVSMNGRQFVIDGRKSPEEIASILNPEKNS